MNVCVLCKTFNDLCVGCGMVEGSGGLKSRMLFSFSFQLQGSRVYITYTVYGISDDKII